MKQNAPKSNSDDIIELTDVIDDDMEKRHILCPTEKKDHLRLVYSSLFSVIFHVGFYTILAYAAATYPVIFTSSDQEPLWFYPSLLTSSQQVSEDEDKSETDSNETSVADKAVTVKDKEPDSVAVDETKDETQAGAEAEVINIYTPPVAPRKVNKPIHQKQPPPAPAAAKPVTAAVREQPEIAVPEDSGKPRTDSMPPPQPAAPSQQIASAGKPAEPPVTREKTETDKAKPVFDNNSVKQTVKPPVAAIETIKTAEIRKPGQAVKTVPVPDQHVQTAFVSPKNIATLNIKPTVKQKSAPVAISSPKKVSMRTPPATLQPRTLPSAQAAAARESVVQSVNSANTAAQGQVMKPDSGRNKEKAPSVSDVKPKAFSMPPLPGDLKFEISADESIQRGVRVKVFFRDFPKARRNRAMSKSEASRIQALSTKVVLTRPDAIQAIVETAAEGVYLLRVELDRMESIQASVSIKLYETGPKARTRSLGRQKITNNQTVVRILMPEGILWEDNSAFSGSMEDSNSVTKYNNDNGLVWKEYH